MHRARTAGTGEPRHGPGDVAVEVLFGDAAGLLFHGRVVPSGTSSS